MDTTMLLNTLWILVGAAMIFFMQAGFAMVEAGFTRAKNAGNIVMKNIIDLAVGSIMFWVIGYGLLYGVQPGGFIGHIDLFTTAEYGVKDIPFWAHMVYNTMFCATAATIVSGAMAGRTHFKAYLVYSVVISSVIYPISASWVWGGGWLSTLSIGRAVGFLDYSGSALVHMVGGICAFIGAAFLGPRIGKYTKDGKARAIPGHNITLGALGVFILWFGWFGFNALSNNCITSADGANTAARVFMVTNLSAACSTVSAMLFSWVRYKKPDVTMTLNGALGGLVAITAGCAYVEPYAAAIIGIFAGILVVLGIEFIEKKCKVDDPVGAVAVHGGCGLFGTIMVGLFATDSGLLTTGDWGQLAIQLIGVLAIGCWTIVLITVTFAVLKKTIGLRVSEDEEIQGLDATEHGLQNAYADFLSATSIVGMHRAGKPVKEDKALGKTPLEEAVPVEIYTKSNVDRSHLKLTKVEILTKQSKFEELKTAMNEIGVTGMTVVQVLGCGMQKGAPEFYRGQRIDDIQLLPKIQVQIVVAKVPVEKVIEAAKKVLYTGHIGDGKIFVYDVENAIKIRTGEEGYNAMQGVDE